MRLTAPTLAARISVAAVLLAIRRRLPFTRLRTRLTVLYAALFGVAMLLVKLAPMQRDMLVRQPDPPMKNGGATSAPPGVHPPDVGAVRLLRGMA